MKTYLLGLTFQVLAKINHDPQKQQALNQMAAEMFLLSRNARKGARKSVNTGMKMVRTP